MPTSSHKHKNLCQEPSSFNSQGALGTFCLPFTKMHGCGNDYIYFNAMEREILNPEALAVRLSHRHKGIGGDGIVLVLPSASADAKIRMWNPDGSEASMYGNAIRCMGKFLYENKIAGGSEVTVETLNGIRTLELMIEDGEVTAVKVDMGQAILAPEEIPVNLTGATVVQRRVHVTGQPYEITCVSVGNPHAVIFHDDIDHFDLHVIGPAFEHAELFPQKTSLEIVEMVSRNHIRMRVWERGTGETMACGTGACAAAVAAVLIGYCDKDEDITVELRGGTLIIKYTDDAVYMTGDCVKVFEGTVKI